MTHCNYKDTIIPKILYYYHKKSDISLPMSVNLLYFPWYRESVLSMVDREWIFHGRQSPSCSGDAFFKYEHPFYREDAFRSVKHIFFVSIAYESFKIHFNSKHQLPSSSNIFPQLPVDKTQKLRRIYSSRSRITQSTT